MPLDAALAQYLSGLFCDGLSLANYLQPNQDGLLNFTNRIGLSLITPVGGLSNLGGQAAQFLTDTQRAVGSAICDIPPDDFSPVQPSPQFTGGRCVGAFYSFSATVSQAGSGVTPSRTFTGANIPGPICRFELRFNPSQGPLGTDSFVLVRGQNCEIEVVVSTQARSSSFGGWSNLRNVSVTRQGGLPDNCGNNPVNIPPEVKDPFSVVGPDLDVDGGPGNGGYTIPSPTINFGPVTLNQDNGLEVDIELPDEGICGTFTLTPQPAFNLKPCTPPPLPGSKQPLPEKGDEDVDPPEELDEDDPEQEQTTTPNKTIVGVFLQSEPDGDYPQTEIDGGDGGALLIPRIATLNFKCVIETPEGVEIERGWTTPVNVQQVRAYIPAPQGVRVVDWSFVAQPGWRCKGLAFEEDYPLCPCKDDRIDIPT